MFYYFYSIGLESQFKKYTHILEEKHRTPYDYHSIMHYPKNAFSANGEDTIVPKDTNAVIGVRTELSEIDIKELNTLYGCSKSILRKHRASLICKYYLNSLC